VTDTQTTPTDTSGLYDHAGYWLSRLQAEMHGRLERRLSEHGVTAAQWGVLIALHQGASNTVRGLAAFLAVDGGAVTRLVDRLEGKGLVARQVDRADRRSVLLSLSETGRALIGPLVQAVDEHDTEILQGLSAEERGQFLSALSRLLTAQGIEPHGRPFDDAASAHSKPKSKSKAKAEKTASSAKPDTPLTVAAPIEKLAKSGKKDKKAGKDKKGGKGKKDKKGKKKKGKKKGKK
jgi:DNA-binding MarR family transcriptional regulator